MTRNLTDKQQSFLDVLFSPEVKGDLLAAKKASLFSDGTPTKSIVESLSDEIADLTKKFIASSGTKSAYAMYEVLTGTDDLLGRKERMAAAKDLLDRGGFAKTDKVEISAPNALFILPPKEKKEDES
ncbi:MAG: hypothetical protein COA78_20265 [Blastopirellula sp.]|nr:MAG: hypothetical protein COA78_20265 [Blastopirellula sp.]